MNETSNTLLKYLKDFNNSYFIIGGQAAAIQLAKIDLNFRVTKDYDIVLVSNSPEEGFYKMLLKLISDGKYENNYVNGKKNAYRFELPKNPNFPTIIELFCEQGQYPESLNKRFAKLNLIECEDKISAMVMNKEIYNFALSHKVVESGIAVLDTYGLIALKSFAYFENKKLREEGKVHKGDVEKHKNDIITLVSSLLEGHKIDLPKVLEESMNDFYIMLKNGDFNQTLKSRHLDKDDIIERFHSLL